MSTSQETDLRSRRDFCALACRAASMAAAGAIWSACGGSPTSPGGDAPQLSSLSGTVAGRTITASVAGTPLATVGGAALITSSIGAFLAFRASDTAVNVLTAQCTHEACTVSGFASSQYVCPCHGSRFNTSGGVVNGPAASPLRQFTSTLTGSTLIFTA